MYTPVRYNSQWNVICELCEKSFKKLGSHLVNKHKILTVEYRKMYWLDMNTKLMCKESIELARKNLFDNYKVSCKKNLIEAWEGTRFTNWHKGRVREQCSEQTMNRLWKLYFYKKIAK